MAFKVVISRIGAYGGFILLFISFAFLLKGRTHVWYLVLLDAFLSAVLFLDMLYFRGFNTMPTLHVFSQASNLENLSTSITALIHRNDLLFFLDIVMLFAAGFYFWRRPGNFKRNIPLFAAGLIASIALIAFFPAKLSASSKTAGTSAIYSYDSTVTCYNLSPLGYNLYSLYAYWNDSRPYTLTAADKDKIRAWFEQKQEKVPDNEYKAIFKGKNLIFIQWESLENFVIHHSVNGQEITPVLNRLLDNSLYFSNFYAQVNEGTSSDADLLVNTSVYPIRHGSTFFRYPNTEFNSLPRLLKGMGYYSSALHPVSGSFWNWRVALSSMGFDRCIDASSYDCSDSFGIGLSDASSLKQAEAFIRQQPQPFYSFVVTMSSHTPYDLPKTLRELSLASSLDESTLGGYLQSIHYADKQVGIFLDNLRKDGLLDNSVIVLYGDHEGVHKYFGDAVAKVSLSEDWWLKNNNQIPLIIYQNGFKGKEVKTIGGQVDILPTVLYLMGVEEDKYASTAMGRNLLKTGKSFAVMPDGKTIEENSSPEDSSSAVRGLDIADRIIRGNYFKNP
jgi:phosphoglycerol transferase MdoB-like AlkP superfamily enzyme